jgi:hypothetical protein
LKYNKHSFLRCNDEATSSHGTFPVLELTVIQPVKKTPQFIVLKVHNRRKKHQTLNLILSSSIETILPHLRFHCCKSLNGGFSSRHLKQILYDSFQYYPFTGVHAYVSQVISCPSAIYKLNCLNIFISLSVLHAPHVSYF